VRCLSNETDHEVRPASLVRLCRQHPFHHLAFCASDDGKGISTYASKWGNETNKSNKCTIVGENKKDRNRVGGACRKRITKCAAACHAKRKPLAEFSEKTHPQIARTLLPHTHTHTLTQVRLSLMVAAFPSDLSSCCILLLCFWARRASCWPAENTQKRGKDRIRRTGKTRGRVACVCVCGENKYTE